ncbi:MAG: hypothetical protein KOO60_03255 [Gemmatimonadales bacterium]|nr:hypothetical protein [Gemmatimonadales bacterium]
MKMQIPSVLLDTDSSKLVRVMSVLGFRPPFVLPWSSPVRMSGAAISEAGITLAHGRLVGVHYQVDSATRIGGTNMMLGIFERNQHEGEPVCVGLPRKRTFVRHFHVPSESEAEIETMLPHLLASELPMSIDHYSWVWELLLPPDEGDSLVAVYIARNDGLAEFLSPLEEVGFNIVGLIPEGWAWAHAIREAGQSEGGPDEDQPQSVIVRDDSGPYLVVQKSGKLLFDAKLAPATLHDPGDSTEYENCLIDWDSPTFVELRKKFEDLLGFPLPEPVIWPDALEHQPEKGKESFFFSASIAASGIEQERLLVPEILLKKNPRRVFLRTFAVLGRLSLVAALAWLAFMMFEDHQISGYLNVLNQQIRQEQPGIENLEVEFNAIRENSRERAENVEILRALTSLRRNLKAPIFLEHLSYVQGRGITLRGGASASSQVLEMTDLLAMDPLWQELRVTQLRSEQASGVERVHFVVEGQLD